MVQTRRQYNHWVANRGDQYQSSQESCDACSQRSSESSQHSNGFDFGDGGTFANGPSHAQYHRNDRCKRHRLHDDVPKTERVVSYLRRK